MNYCQDGIEAYYGTETQQYYYAPIYGHYELQPDDVNGRSYFKRESIGLWWDGIGGWWIGSDSDKGQSFGVANFPEDLFCPHQLTGFNWGLSDGTTWTSAGNDLGIRCKYIFVIIIKYRAYSSHHINGCN